jgi:hypothetical protein
LKDPDQEGIKIIWKIELLKKFSGIYSSTEELGPG